MKKRERKIFFRLFLPFPQESDSSKIPEQKHDVADHHVKRFDFDAQGSRGKNTKKGKKIKLIVVSGCLQIEELVDDDENKQMDQRRSERWRQPKHVVKEKQQIGERR